MDAHWQRVVLYLLPTCKPSGTLLTPAISKPLPGKGWAAKPKGLSCSSSLDRLQAPAAQCQATDKQKANKKPWTMKSWARTGALLPTLHIEGNALQSGVQCTMSVINIGIDPSAACPAHSLGIWPPASATAPIDYHQAHSRTKPIELLPSCLQGDSKQSLPSTDRAGLMSFKTLESRKSYCACAMQVRRSSLHRIGCATSPFCCCS